MNITKHLFAAPLLMLFAAMLGACSSADGPGEPDFVQFPKEITIPVSLTTEGQTTTAEFEFDAIANWTLASTAPSWCKFMNGGKAVPSLTGEAGHQKVTILVSSENQDFDAESSAKLLLIMQGETGTIATVYRTPRSYHLALTDGDTSFDADNAMPFTYTVMYNGGRIEGYTLNVSSNFDWVVKSKPQWIAMQFDGEDLTEGPIDMLVDFGFAEGAKRSKASEEGDCIVFTDRATQTQTISVPVTYGGMPADAIEFNVASPNVTFSQDGTQHWVPSLMSDQEPEHIATPLTLGVETPGGYKVVIMESTQWGLRAQDAEEYWGYINLDDDGEGNIALTLKPNEKDGWQNDGKERKAYLVVLPTAVYNALPQQWGYADLESLIDPDDPNYIAYEYEKYQILSITQEGQKEEGGFKFINPITFQEYAGLETYTLDDMGMSADDALENYGTTNIIGVNITNNMTGLLVCPEGYDVENPMVWVKNWQWEDGLMAEPYTYPSPGALFSITPSELPQGECPVVFYDANYETFAVVIFMHY